MSEVVNLTTDECCEHLSKAIHTFVCSAGLKTFVTIHYRPYVTGREVSIEAFPHATDYDDPVKVCDHMEQFLQNFDIPFKRLNTKIEFKEEHIPVLTTGFMVLGY